MDMQANHLCRPTLAASVARQRADALYRLSGPMAGVVIYALSMRTYGPELLGKYAYATTMCNMLAPLLVSGIDPLLVREL